METGVYQIEFNDGRIFRIFCANSTQVKKIITFSYKNVDKIKEIIVLTNGIHTVKQFEQFFKD